LLFEPSNEFVIPSAALSREEPALFCVVFPQRVRYRRESLP